MGTLNSVVISEQCRTISIVDCLVRVELTVSGMDKIRMICMRFQLIIDLLPVDEWVGYSMNLGVDGSGYYA